MSPDREHTVKLRSKSADEPSVALRKGQIGETQEAIRRAAARFETIHPWRKRK